MCSLGNFELILLGVLIVLTILLDWHAINYDGLNFSFNFFILHCPTEDPFRVLNSRLIVKSVVKMS